MFPFMNFLLFFKHFTNHLVWIEIDIHNIKGIFLGEISKWSYLVSMWMYEAWNIQWSISQIRQDNKRIQNVSMFTLAEREGKCWCQCFSVMIRDRLNALKTALGINELVWHTSWYQFQYKISVLLLKHY